LLGLPEIKSALTISSYLHTGSEVRTKEIVERFLVQGKRVIVPITERSKRKLLFSELRAPGRELERGTFGILEPKPEFRRPFPLDGAQVILVPGVAWDLRGYRIGYGAGLYDRSINSLHASVMKIGLSYEFQILENIPRTYNDRPVDKIVTERRIIDTGMNPF
jgi:5-formyltetrahydrofolate cyclo-ligase